jgi:creatinine amidohydrolase
MIRQFDRMTFDEVESYLEREPRIIVLPVGATEQHGIHGALGTDTFAALAVALRVAEKVDGLVAPAMPYGMSGNHRHYPGFAGLQATTLVTVLTELLHGFIQQGFRTALLISGHRGNEPAVAIAASDARERARDMGIDGVHVLHMSYQDANRGRLKAVVDLDRIRDIDVAYGSDGHGGAVESSVAMTLAPDGFRPDKLETPDSTWADKRRGLSFKPVLDSDEITDKGIFGDPVGMSEELGERIVELTAERIAADLASYLTDFKDGGARGRTRTRG